MSSLRSQDMTLYQVMINRDNSWEIMHQMLEADYLHYVTLTDHKQPHELLFVDIVRRADDLGRKITYIEKMYSDYAVPLKGPENFAQLEAAVQQTCDQEKCAQKQLMDFVEAQINEQDRFIKEQHGLLTKSIKGFVEILQRISVFENVSRILKV